MEGKLTDFRDPGEVPVLDWIDKDVIDIDPAYQRGLDDARVQRILDWFEWRSFGAVVIAMGTVQGRFNCIDGQHRLAAAKLHPNVSVVPAVIVAAEGAQAEAETFVTVNRNRKNVSALDLYWAELAADDPEAKTVKMACADAGVKILRYPSPTYGPGETIAIAAIRSVIDRHGRMRARQMLQVLADARLAPIQGVEIRAAELLLIDDEFCNEVDAEGLTASIAGSQRLEITAEAKAFAKTHRMPAARAFASVWFRKTRKKRKAA